MLSVDFAGCGLFAARAGLFGSLDFKFYQSQSTAFNFAGRRGADSNDLLYAALAIASRQRLTDSLGSG